MKLEIGSLKDLPMVRDRDSKLGRKVVARNLRAGNNQNSFLLSCTKLAPNPSHKATSIEDSEERSLIMCSR